MIIHIVYFWLKPGIDEAGRKQFLDGAKSLLTIESMSSGYVGVPAATESRPIIDASYDYALVTLFDDMTAHDAYQIHPVHDAFRTLAPLWDRVQIYDSEIC